MNNNFRKKMKENPEKFSSKENFWKLEVGMRTFWIF